MVQQETSFSLPMWSGAALVVLGILAFAVVSYQAPSSSYEPVVGQATQTSQIGHDALMGFGVSFGEATMRVDEAVSFTEMGLASDTRTTDELFVKPLVTIRNEQEYAIRVDEMEFVLVDENQNIYERLADDGLYVDGTTRLAGWLRPGQERTSAMVFEVPAETQNLGLFVSSVDSEVVFALDAVENIGVDFTLEDRMVEEMLAYEEEFYDEEYDEFY